MYLKQHFKNTLEKIIKKLIKISTQNRKKNSLFVFFLKKTKKIFYKNLKKTLKYALK